MHHPPRARFFRRDDRDQLADLVNVHLSTVIPGARVSVNTVLSTLERQPDEYVLDPWVTERATIVVEQRDRVVAAAHLQRFSGDARVSDDYRDAGLIQFALAFPDSDDASVLDVLLRACLAQLRTWRVGAVYADGQLPFPGVTGVPASWPHVRRAFVRAGFVHAGSREVVLMATSAALAGARVASERITVRRELGPGGVRFVAGADGADTGYLQLDLTVGRPERHPVGPVLAELSDEDAEDPAVRRALLAEAGEWMRLGGVHALLVVVDGADAQERARWTGFREVTENARGWRYEREEETRGLRPVARHQATSATQA